MRVKRFKVTAYDRQDRKVGSTVVETVNHRFARSFAAERFVRILGAAVWVNEIGRMGVGTLRK